jgi:hypothetical protein
VELSLVQLLGTWLSIFLTLSILSFLYDDNPIYKLAEHLFLGVSVGVAIIEQYYGVFKPNLVDKLLQGNRLSVVPLALLVLLFFKLSRKNSWLARVPIAFLVAAYAGIKLTGEANANLMTQVAQTMPDLAASFATNGFWSWSADGAGLFSDLLLVTGLVACLSHFYFSELSESTARVGTRVAWPAFALAALVVWLLDPGSLPMSARAAVAGSAGLVIAMPFLAFSAYKPWVSRFGVLVLMLSFGASFGYTVMGRLSLAIGRAQELLGFNRPAVQVAQIHPRVVSLIGIVLIVSAVGSPPR